MKKNLDKFITISLATMSLIFVVFLLVLIFDSEIAVEANNTVVKALFLVFSVIFSALTTLNIVSSFRDNEKVNQVLLYKTKNSAKKASVTVIRQIAKRAVTAVPNVKIDGITLSVDEANDVFMKATVKIKAAKEDTSVMHASVILERANAALAIEFKDVLGLEFKGIELNLVSAKSKHVPDAAEIAARADAVLSVTESEAKAVKQEQAEIETRADDILLEMESAKEVEIEAATDIEDADDVEVEE